MDRYYRLVTPIEAKAITKEIKELTGISTTSAVVLYSLKRVLREEQRLAGL